MSFVSDPSRVRGPRLDGVSYRDPIMSRRVARPRGVSGLGANTAALTSSGAAAGGAVGAGAAVLAGAAAGSVVPVLGTAIGAVVGLVVGLLGGGGNKESGGDKNPIYVATTNKWYYWLLGRPTDSSGAVWWPGQMQANGLPNAWMNFSTSKEPAAAGVAAKAAQYQSLGYGAPTDPPPAGTSPFVPPPLNLTYQQYVQTPGLAAAMSAGASPEQIAALAPTGATAPQQASLLPAMSPTMMLLIGGGLLVGLVLKKRSPSRRRHS